MKLTTMFRAVLDRPIYELNRLDYFIIESWISNHLVFALVINYVLFIFGVERSHVNFICLGITGMTVGYYQYTWPISSSFPEQTSVPVKAVLKPRS